SVQKTIANDDVTIDSDYTGVVITTGNIFIEEGVNVEGLLIAGDRIYVRGNNNIVSGSETLDTLLAEEEDERNSGNAEYGTYAGDYIKRL
ncbi:MAG: hypothetical protein IK123_05515, partial [Lachnospiraceae bacterium]|nr:hypothetical protein [Lachnospiraceae bacterium]